MSFVNWFGANSPLPNILILVGLVVAAWLLGLWSGKAVRMPDYGWKFSLIFFAIFASSVIIYRGWPPKLGIDLGGGAVLVYRVDPTKTSWDPSKMDTLVHAISDRVNPGGQKEVSVRSLGNDMVQIIMPAPSGANEQQKKDLLEETKKIIRTTGALEFRILASRRFDQTLIETAGAARKEACLKDPQTEVVRVVTDPKRIDPRTGRPRVIAEWCRVRNNPRDQEQMRRDDAAIEVYDGKDENGNDKHRVEVLVLAPDSEATDVTGKDIRNAGGSPNTESGGWQVQLHV